MRSAEPYMHVSLYVGENGAAGNLPKMSICLYRFAIRVKINAGARWRFRVANG